jgi:hypothetical protein
MTNIRFGFNLIIAVAFAGGLVAYGQQNSSAHQGVFAGSTDVGATQKGSTVYDQANWVYHVTGGGADMWGAADAFHFSWVRMSGDASLTADVEFPSSGVIPLEKAVLIFRQSLDPGSPYADVAIHGDGHITLQYRVVAGGKTEDVTAPKAGSNRLRIERKGDQFTTYTSDSDGKLTAFSSYTLKMEGPVYVGIGVCAHNADGTAAVTFSKVILQQFTRTEP